MLLKARALIDAACKIDRARAGHDDSNQPQQPRLVARAERERNAPAAAALRCVAAAPVYLKGRAQRGDPLPRVEIQPGRMRDRTRVVVALEYTLVMGEQGNEGMPKEVFVELGEMMVPKWDRGSV